jgi:isopenicillin-N N-acyltransferase-like protein
MIGLTRKTPCLIVLALLAVTASAAEPFRYPEGKHGKGELRYINGLPVLTVGGTRAEMGEQIGVLALKPADALVNHFQEYLEKKGLKNIAPVIFSASEGMFQRFPKEYREEVEAMAKAAGADRNLIVLGNTVFDLQQILGCSGLLVSAERSKTGGALYGRNFDFPFDDLIAEYSLVIVYRPTGKKAFMMVTFPGLLSASVAMNEDGLALGANTVRHSGDGSPPFDPEGMPYFVAAREVMEGLGSVDEFDKWMRGHSRTAMGLLLACDPKRQSIYEITTKNIGVREPEDGLLYCTNHFLLSPMVTKTEMNCWRYPILEKSRDMKHLDVSDVARLLSEVNQGKGTIQTMVFEPSKLVLHLSIGRGPTSEKPLKRLDLKPLLKGEERR